MNAIHNTLSHCVKCLVCMKSCPIEAIHFVDNKAVIQEDKCIDCGRCMQICAHNGIFSQTSKLEAMQDYQYTIILVPSAIYSQFQTKKEYSKFTASLKQLGFQEVVDLSYYSAGVMQASVDYLAQYDHGVLISAHCPVITRLISKKYPTLLPSIIPINYDSELAASQLRAQIIQKTGLSGDQIGIFLLTECPGKIGLAKYPLQALEYEVDHAISLQSIMPKIRKAMQTEAAETADERPYKDGLLHAVKDGVRRIVHDYAVINIDGIEKAIEVLELAEFDRLKGIRFLNLSSCYNGCVGGPFFWTNPFTGRIQLEQFVKEANPTTIKFEFEEVFKEVKIVDETDRRTMKEKIEWFQTIEQIYEKLPGIDCGACGFPSCHHMAEEIAKGNRQLSDCRIK